MKLPEKIIQAINAEVDPVDTILPIGYKIDSAPLIKKAMAKGAEIALSEAGLILSVEEAATLKEKLSMIAHAAIDGIEISHKAFNEEYEKIAHELLAMINKEPIPEP